MVGWAPFGWEYPVRVGVVSPVSRRKAPPHRAVERLRAPNGSPLFKCELCGGWGLSKHMMRGRLPDGLRGTVHRYGESCELFELLEIEK